MVKKIIPLGLLLILSACATVVEIPDEYYKCIHLDGRIFKYERHNRFDYDIDIDGFPTQSRIVDLRGKVYNLNALELRYEWSCESVNP